jgi:hypothetical protein
MVGLVVFSLASGALFVVFLLPFIQTSHASANAPPGTRPPPVHSVHLVQHIPAVLTPRTPPSLWGTDGTGGAPAALDVAMNPLRYVGARVRWTCLVDRVPAPTFADAHCGLSLADFDAPPLTIEELLRRSISQLHRRATVVLTGDVEELDHDERIVFDGTVRTPLIGENAYGAERYYPTIHIDRFLDKRMVDL